ncbi:MAG: cell division protein CrgA [Actinomycetota bacterium]|nr:cell division protein CrgA [Actinomycetota bacterium]
MPKSKSKRTPGKPPPKKNPTSRRASNDWVGALFFTLLGAGVIVIIANYLGAWPGGTEPWKLWAGLGLIASSFVVATQWH